MPRNTPNTPKESTPSRVKAAPKAAATKRHTKVVAPEVTAEVDAVTPEVKPIDPGVPPAAAAVAATAAAGAGSSGPAAASVAFSTEEIARLAYSYWEQRGYQGGSPESDWLRAEQELKTRAAGR